MRVEDIEHTVQRLEAKGVRFAGSIIGERGGDLRQVFSEPEVVDGKPFCVLEQTERHRGYRASPRPRPIS